MTELTEKGVKEYEQQYFVVKNHEEQYSIWPTYKPMPKGWVVEGEPKNKDNCLSYIDEVWTDMRPLSLKKHMEELETKEKRWKGKKGTKTTERTRKSRKKY